MTLSFDQLLLGAILFAGGAILGLVRGVPGAVLGWLKSRFVFTVEVTQADEPFRWLLTWLNAHPSVRHSKRLALQMHRDNDNDEERLTYTPLGVHWFWYRGRPVWISRDRQEQKDAGVFLGMWERASVSTFARRRGLIEDLFKEARAAHEVSRTGKVCIWSLDQWGNWSEIIRKAPRPLNSVILPGDRAHAVLQDLRTFADRAAWYSGIGMPYRRGYLLYGPPGNGKTSLVFALASELRRDLAVVSLAMPELTDDNLRDGLAEMPKNAILLIEDIDGVFRGREPVRPTMKLTFSGLLNALDGVATVDGRVLFVTTNHIDVLDPALIRPGRIDVQVAIDKPERAQVLELYRRFFGDAPYAGTTDGYSMAEYQERFIRMLEG